MTLLSFRKEQWEIGALVSDFLYNIQCVTASLFAETVFLCEQWSDIVSFSLRVNMCCRSNLDVQLSIAQLFTVL